MGNQITVAVTGPADGVTREITLLVRKVLEDYAGLAVTFTAGGQEVTTNGAFIDYWNEIRRRPGRHELKVTLEEYTRG